jgi:hypothetical protein
VKGVCSLLVDAASAVADIRALIWRISRSSVDGCITFSFDLGPTRRFLILVYRKSATDKIANTDCDRLLASLNFSEQRLPSASPATGPGNIPDTACR